MINILSWNIHTYKGRKTKQLKQTITEIVNENNIHVVVFQEAFGKMVKWAVNGGFLQYDEIIHPANIDERGVRMFILKNTFDTPKFIEKNSKNKLMFVSLGKKGSKETFNIAAVHLHSKIENTERQQMWKIQPILNEIKKFEMLNSNKTIIVGDLNHNPYDRNLCDPYLINCKDSKDLISTLTKYPIPKNANYDFWYNPMWNFLGDYDYNTTKNRVTGTYFRYSNNESPIWNLIDGFILRPSIMDKIDYKNSKILIETKSGPFLKDFTISKQESIIYEYLSDHLPIKLAINLN